MYHVCIKPTTFDLIPIQDKQNPYIDIEKQINQSSVKKQHNNFEKAFLNSKLITYTINPISKNEPVPDIVFIANGGLSLPRLKEPTIILPYMKYSQRRRELKYLKEIFNDLHIKTIEFPGPSEAPFEGQAEVKWFSNGTKAICGYGYRSTKKTFTILHKQLRTIYEKENLIAPTFLAVPLESADYYHLDVAMLEFDDTKCIVHKRAFSEKSIEKMRKFLGSENVHVIDTEDSFCLNSVIDGENLITHKITDQNVKKEIEEITGRKIKQVSTTEFEKSGGSVRCMTLDVHI